MGSDQVMAEYRAEHLIEQHAIARMRKLQEEIARMAPPSQIAVGSASGLIPPLVPLRPKFDVEISYKLSAWLGKAIGEFATEFIETVIFSQRVAQRLRSEPVLWPYGEIMAFASAEDDGCVVRMMKSLGQATGSIILLRVPEEIIEQIVSDEVRQRLEASKA